ncbi:MAG: DUF4175 family protein [Pseudomonadota bacterium]
MADAERAKLARKINQKITLTRAVMVWERFLYAFWPALCLIAVFIVHARWGIFGGLADQLRFLAYGGSAVGLLVLFARGTRRFKFVSRDAAVARLDLALEDMPLTALDDTLSQQSQDDQTKALWALHQARMAKRAEDAAVPGATVRLSDRDPWGLRLVSLVALAMAAVFADPDAGRRLANLNSDETVTGPRFEFWARPLAYTGMPTIYLNDVDGAEVITLPVNTEILLRSYAPIGELRLSESVSVTGSTVLPDSGADFQSINFSATQDGHIRMTDMDGEDRAWEIVITPDAPPEVEITGEMTRNINGAMQLPFEARDDYGITGGELTITLDVDQMERRFGYALDPEPRADLRAELPLPLSGDLSLFSGVIEEDYAKHPWAGLPIELDLSVRDAAGGEGAIETLSTPFAKKRFFDPLAAAIVDIRAQILWNRANLDRADYLLRAISYKPEGVINQKKAFLLMRSAIRRIGYFQSTDIADDEAINLLADQLWEAALLVEHGDLNDARERLERAQERLNEAMENGATPEEIQELMQELREATRDYIRQLAESAERQEQQAGNAPQGQPITQDQLQEMMDRIQELMEQGRMEEAQELLRQLQEMMENMQVVQQQGNGQGEGGQGLQDTLRQQQDLADDTFRELQEQFDRQNGQGQQNGQNQRGENQEGEGQGQSQEGNGQGEENLGGGGQGGEESLSDLAARQEALRQMLEGQRGQLPNEGGQAGDQAEESLGNAGENMESAEDAIREGDLGEALNQQAEALDELRRGMRALNEQRRAANSQGEGGGQGDAAADGRTGFGNEQDPLGRSRGGFDDQNGSAISDGRSVTSDQNRRRDVEQLRDNLLERLENRERPQFELDYLDRLLDRF